MKGDARLNQSLCVRRFAAAQKRVKKDWDLSQTLPTHLFRSALAGGSQSLNDFRGNSSRDVSYASRSDPSGVADTATRRPPLKAVLTVASESLTVLTCNDVAIGILGEDLVGRSLTSLLCPYDEDVELTELHLDPQGCVLRKKSAEQELVSVFSQRLPSGGRYVLLEEAENCGSEAYLDQQGCIEAVDGWLARTFGGKPLDFLGTPISTFLPDLKLEYGTQHLLVATPRGLDLPVTVSLKADGHSGYRLNTLSFPSLAGLVTVRADATVHSINNFFSLALLGRPADTVVGNPISSVIESSAVLQFLPDSSLGSLNTTLDDLTASMAALHAEPSAASTPCRKNMRKKPKFGDCDSVHDVAVRHVSGRSFICNATFWTVNLEEGGDLLLIYLSATQVTEAPQDPVNDILTEKDSIPEESLHEPGTFAGDYQLCTMLGRGAYGVVWHATDRCSGDFVVVKSIIRAKVNAWGPANIPVADGTSEKPPLEIYLLMTTSHPYIVSAHRWYMEADFYHLVMEPHGVGMDLFEFIDQGPVFDDDEVLIGYMFNQLLSAVGYLHERGITHRDIKDENIIINGEFKLQLIDFGAAAMMNDGRPFSVFVGTPEYCPPEVLAGKAYTGEQLDIWSLGITLFVLCDFRHPFTQEDLAECCVSPLKFELPPSPELRNLLSWMLHERPKARPRSIQQLMADSAWLQRDLDISGFTMSKVLPEYENFQTNLENDSRDFSVDVSHLMSPGGNYVEEERLTNSSASSNSGRGDTVFSDSDTERQTFQALEQDLPVPAPESDLSFKA